MNAPNRALAQRSQWQVIVDDAKDEFSSLAAQLPETSKIFFEKEASFVVDLLNKNEFLRKCTTESIRTAFKNVAALGITLNPAMKLAYLVPREGACCLDISAQGLCKIATDSGSVEKVKATIVRQHDEFEWIDEDTKPIHKYRPFDSDNERGPIVGVYVVAHLKKGGVMVEALNMDTINKIKSVSRAKNGPWVTWPEEMIKKTALKRAYKSWPKTERLSAAEAFLNETEGMVLDEDINGADAAAAPAASGRPPRQNPADIARRAVEQETQPTPERAALLAKLEQCAVEQGANAYESLWLSLQKEQRKMIGTPEHQRLKALATHGPIGDTPFVEMPRQEARHG